MVVLNLESSLKLETSASVVHRAHVHSVPRRRVALLDGLADGLVEAALAVGLEVRRHGRAVLLDVLVRLRLQVAVGHQLLLLDLLLWLLEEKDFCFGVR